MATFNLPTTKRLPGLSDPNLLPKRPGVDYAARADEAWREIEENLTALGSEAEQYEALFRRIVAGETWLSKNQIDDQYMEAYQLINELTNTIKGIDINLKSLKRVIWSNCMVLYACMVHGEWRIDRRNPETARVMSPEEIWRYVCPGREQPGAYPPEKREQWLDRKLTYTGWSLK
jgi:hypothetical protein